MKTLEKWCIRCLCGQKYILDAVVISVVCDCGAKLVRTRDNCYAEVDGDYDVSSKPYDQPSIYRCNRPIDK